MVVALVMVMPSLAMCSLGVYCFSSEALSQLSREGCSVPDHFLGVEGASVSFGKREPQVRALRAFHNSSSAAAFAGYGALWQREDHVIVAASVACCRPTKGQCS